MSIQNFSHLGICVSDLSASGAFYRDALGFEELHGMTVAGADAERLLGLSGVKLDALYLRRDGVVIELLAYEAPGPEAEDGPRPMNRTGLTHLSLRVSDLDQALEAVEASGGHVLRDTETRNPGFHTAVAFVTDPDGTRIELLQMPGDPARLPGA